MVKAAKSPPVPKNALKAVRMSDELVARIDEWRRQQPDIPTQGEAIRRLVELGLSVKPKVRGKGQ